MPMILEPTSGLLTTFTRWDFEVLTRAVYTAFISYNLRGWVASTLMKVLKFRGISLWVAKVKELKVGRINPAAFGREASVCRIEKYYSSMSIGISSIFLFSTLFTVSLGASPLYQV